MFPLISFASWSLCPFEWIPTFRLLIKTFEHSLIKYVILGGLQRFMSFNALSTQIRVTDCLTPFSLLSWFVSVTGERPDTIHLELLPCKWFFDQRFNNANRPSPHVLQKVSREICFAYALPFFSLNIKYSLT